MLRARLALDELATAAHKLAERRETCTVSDLSDLALRIETAAQALETALAQIESKLAERPTL